MKTKKIEPLPSSNDVKFWGEDAELIKHEDVQKFEPNETHNWKQRGNKLMCKSCSLDHGLFIRSDMELTGISETGEPILKKIEIRA